LSVSDKDIELSEIRADKDKRAVQEMMHGKAPDDVPVDEKHKSANKNLNMVFVDLKKAYGRVPRTVLW
jgi:hypothetical protein